MAESKLAGMTMNERLLNAGLLGLFDSAATRRDRDAMIEILGRVDLEDQANSITKTILASPETYGY